MPPQNTLYVEEAVSWIRENCVGVTHVGFSGGKDSICLAGLMKLSQIKYELHYQYTGIDPPELLHFIRRYYPKTFIHFPQRSFWSLLLTQNVPNGKLRWCCRTQKKTPEIPRILGVRKEESTQRSKYPRVNYIKNVPVYYPILNWQEWQVWEFIERCNLPFPMLYDIGFDRLGCIICPFHSESTGKKHSLYRQHWPKYFDTFEKYVNKLYLKRQAQGRKMYYKSSEEFCRAWYLDDMARWYAE